jgi:hypothetical protein
LRDADDYVHLYEASTHDAILVTTDKGFESWNGAWVFWARRWQIAATHSGVLVVPQERIWLPARMIVEIERFLGTNPPLTNECYLAHPNGYWQRQ